MYFVNFSPTICSVCGWVVNKIIYFSMHTCTGYSRLTVVDDNEECKYTESCIGLIPDSGSGDDIMGEARYSTGGSGAFGESGNLTERVSEKTYIT